MATLLIGVPSDRLSRVLDAYAGVYGYDPAGGEELSEFLRRIVVQQMTEVVVQWEAQQAATVAQSQAIEATRSEIVLTPIYPEWQPGISVQVGDVLAWDGTLVECIQPHTTQADWTPGLTPALWRVYRDVANEPATPDWRAGIAVQVGETFVYQGHTYRVRQAHTTQAGWEPPTVPALWQIVE